MPSDVSISLDPRHLALIESALSPSRLRRVFRRAGLTALRDARSESRKRIRSRKRLGLKLIGEAIKSVKPSPRARISGMEFRLDFSGDPVPLSAYKPRQIRSGVSVSVNKGKRTRIRSAFIAQMRSGHRGVFIRKGRGRLPIRELLGSRPVDAMLHEGEADGALKRGARSFEKTFSRLWRIEIDK